MRGNYSYGKQKIGSSFHYRPVASLSTLVSLSFSEKQLLAIAAIAIVTLLLVLYSVPLLPSQVAQPRLLAQALASSSIRLI